jgi:hypothetical protein
MSVGPNVQNQLSYLVYAVIDQGMVAQLDG